MKSGKTGGQTLENRGQALENRGLSPSFKQPIKGVILQIAASHGLPTGGRHAKRGRRDVPDYGTAAAMANSGSP